jgi:hypothetical protein
VSEQLETMRAADAMLERLRDKASPRLREVAEAMASMNGREAIELITLWLGEDFAAWCDRKAQQESEG